MKPSKSNESASSSLQEDISDTAGDGDKELCPGFREVDDFVKVSERNLPLKVSTSYR